MLGWLCSFINCRKFPCGTGINNYRPNESFVEVNLMFVHVRHVASALLFRLSIVASRSYRHGPRREHFFPVTPLLLLMRLLLSNWRVWKKGLSLATPASTGFTVFCVEQTCRNILSWLSNNSSRHLSIKTKVYHNVSRKPCTPLKGNIKIMKEKKLF
jgi:hypothetical protein